MSVQIGIDVLRASGFAALRGKRVGLLTNLNAVDGDLVTTYDILRTAPEVNLTALFSPEHGLAAVAADGETVHSSVDSLTGLPIHSLYGETKAPTADMLADVDVIVCDIQDIGVRYYTFTWTVTHVLEAAGKYGIPVVIPDRPNPLGNEVKGMPLDERFRSLVGRFPVPTQPGMTLGELAKLVNARWNPTPAQLSVIPCAGYRADMLWDETGLTFVPPSPNMPHVSTVQHYPGACLIEGTSLSEGRGTALPFEIVGAPDLDGAALAQALNDRGLAGVRFRPYSFRPTSSKHVGAVCGGVQAHITDARSYQPLETWLTVLAAIYQQQPFAWNDHFERLIGVAGVRELIEQHAPLDDLFAQARTFCAEFDQQRQPYLIYRS